MTNVPVSIVLLPENALASKLSDVTNMSKDVFPATLLSEMYSGSKLSDITFIVENEEFKVHKAVLGNTCPYFKVLLYGNTNEASQNVITLKETLARAFKCVVEFIYTGNVDSHSLEDDCYCKEVIAIAHEYQFDALITRLIEKIQWHQKQFPFVACVLEMSLKYDCDDLKEKCLEYIDGRAATIISEKEEFATLTFNAVNEIVRRQTFVVNEIDLFHCLMHYKQKHNDVDLKQILSNLQLGLISKEDFKKYVLPLNVYNLESYLLAIENAFKRIKSGNSSGSKSVQLIRNGVPNFPQTLTDLNLAIGETLQCGFNNIITNHITLPLMKNVFIGSFKILAKDKDELEYTEIFSVENGLRYGVQTIHFIPRGISSILIRTGTNSLRFQNLQIACCSDCNARFNENDGNLIGKCKLGSLDPIELGSYNGGTLPAKDDNECYKLFGFPQPSYYYSLQLDDLCILKLPLTFYVKGSYSEDWKLLTKLTMGRKTITFPLCLISMILFVGTEMEYLKFSCC